MTDDIVTRLREARQEKMLTWATITDAANEIECLRMEIDNLKAEIQRLSQIAKY
jgi:FtsZ-binding cell division protein ZapB